MFISRIKINNFRNFVDQEIQFNDGINVIIGHNNAGKTNLLKALSLVLDADGKKRLGADDFNKHATVAELQLSPPRISIEITINRGVEEDDDLAMIGPWLTKLDPSYEAKLTYQFYLPDSEAADYGVKVQEVLNKYPGNREKVWRMLQHDFMRRYKSRILGGVAANQTVAEADNLRKFDFQFLDAIRDVERDMHTGRAALLRDVLDFFMDYEIKSLPTSTKSKQEKDDEIRTRRTAFAESADVLIEALQVRMKVGKVEILSYAKETGASFDGAAPDFAGSITDVEMFSALQLIVEHNSGIRIPASHNGLGYNNLIYMSLLLAKMQMNSDMDYMGGNSKIFATLVIEEPEAHLHPAMQYKFLKFLKANRKSKKVRQVFLTTHSAHITSAVGLDEIICLSNNKGQITVGYPGRVFPDEKSKMYVQRFLDATKSEMLFAKSIIFVEGIAEQLLMSIFAQYDGLSLEDSQVSVINVGGRYFEHFLHLFANDKPNTIHKTVACVTDRDPEWRKAIGKGRFEKCYPFEYLVDPVSFHYQSNDIPAYKANCNIKYFSQDLKKGKTFEYELLLSNPSLELLLTDSMSNAEELREMMLLHSSKKPVKDILVVLRKSTENDRIAKGIEAATTWGNDELAAAIIASRYLNSVGKGENALELSYALRTNHEAVGTPAYKEFITPKYLKESIEWVCK